MSHDPVTFGSHFFEFDDVPSSDEVLRAESWIRQSVRNNINFSKAVLDDIYGNFELTIPEYQRGYAWEEQQLEELWMELEPAFTDDLPRDELSEVFFGSIFIADSGSNTAEIIDGQQRLTTISIILKLIQEELADTIAEIPLETPDNVREIAFRNKTLIDTVLYDDADSVNPDPAITLNEHNHPFYAALMDDDAGRIEYITEQESVHGNRKRNAIRISDYADSLDVDDEVWADIDDDNRAFDESNKRILSAYEYFRKRLTRSLDAHYSEPTERARALVNLKRFLLNGYVVGLFRVSQGYPSLLMDIFQILNDRGMDLNQIDIIRARIVARFSEDTTDEEKTEYLRKWEGIVDRFDGNYSEISGLLVDTLTIIDEDVSGRSEVSDNLLEAFVLNPRGQQTIDSHLDDIARTREFLDTLDTYSKYYHSILYPIDDGLELNDDARQARANDLLQRLQSLRTTQWIPLVLAVYAAAKDSDAIDTAERVLLDTLEGIENVTFRQVLSNLNPNRLEYIYADVTHDFDPDFDDDYDVKQELYTRFEDEYSAFVGPSFAETINETAVLRPRYGKAILWKLTTERDWDRGMWERQLNIGDVHLEHFFPQTPLLKGDDGDRYRWFRTFFGTDAADPDGLRRVIDALIEQENDDALNTIVDDYYTDDLGNLGLLWAADNIAGSNRPLSRKLPIYLESDAGFEEATVNEYFTSASLDDEALATLRRYYRLQKAADATEGTWDDHESKLESGAETYAEFRAYVEDALATMETDGELEDAAAVIDSHWTVEALTERKAQLLERLLESLRFAPDEFDAFDVEEEVRTEIESRNRIAAAEYGDVLS